MSVLAGQDRPEVRREQGAGRGIKSGRTQCRVGQPEGPLALKQTCDKGIRVHGLDVALHVRSMLHVRVGGRPPVLM